VLLSFRVWNTSGYPADEDQRILKSCWAVMGFGGNGITHSRLAAEIIRTALAVPAPAGVVLKRGRYGAGLGVKYV
jgi:hypothetical protein